MTDYYSIEIQQPSNTWLSIRMVIPFNQQALLSEIKQVKSQYPNNRVRAVDKNGRLVDML